MEALFQAVPGILKGLGDNEQATAAFVFAAWRKVAGEQLRQRTEPLGFRQKRLTLAVENAIWKRHLQDLSGDMVYRLSLLLGNGVVNFIELCVDERAVLTAADRKPPAIARTTTIAELPESLKHAADSIRDEGLRESFLSAAGIYLSRSGE